VSQGSHAATIDDDGDDEPTLPDLINLRLPADGRYSRVARVAVSAVAVRLALGPRVIEDLRIALDEALILLLRRVRRDDASSPDLDDDIPDLVIEFEASDDSIVIELTLDPPPEDAAGTPGDAHRDDLDALHRFEELLPPRVEARRLAPDDGVVVLALR
jgi:hypothetical protein